MLISTKGRYALRVMADLSAQGSVYIPLNDIAARQGISEKYLEGILAGLSKAGFLDGVRGKGGGYRLKEKPENIRLYDILKLTEGSLAPVACLSGDAGECGRSAVCPTLPVWEGLDKVIRDYLSAMTVADLLPDSRHQV